MHFDEITFQRLQLLRTRHFPPALNFIPAHLTLLHSASIEQVNRLKLKWGQFNPATSLSLRFTGLRSLGRGTALIVESPGLGAVRTRMMQTMTGQFSRQDQQPFKAHVTIQNKSEPAIAQQLFEQLSANFVAWEGTCDGLMIWRYLGGPWSLDAVLPLGVDCAKVV